MKNKLNRRDFLRATATAGALAATSTKVLGAPAVRRSGFKPVVIASGNGNVYRNGGTETCVELAFRRMTAGDDVLDSLIAGVNIVELDPEEAGVGFGGLPDGDGNVVLDSCCMHGPRKQAGGVAALQGVRTPSLVAQAVAASTDHHLLVDSGAQRFARNMGFSIEDDLNTPLSRSRWLEWKRRTDPGHYLDPEQRAQIGMRVGLEMVAEGKIDAEHYWGTINCNGINANGDICGVTTTSGLAWKIPGRVGDSPILGAGLYVDNEIGAAGSTGRGEANLYNLASFLVVEHLRAGKHPKDAGMETLKRILGNTEKRLLRDDGNPAFNLSFYVINKRGEYAGVAFYGDGNRKFALCSENGAESLSIEGLLG
ncbi:MAG: N(4)-(beta-N-acetylglucosaminyl)-L-asparaginase [Pseudohongiellaceae bacterium]|jgi:N4-(beta-N-acetylglucosaminyl)-L-asparaginase